MEQYTNIAHRIRWVHGNLYVFITQYAIHKSIYFTRLDGIDLPSAHFDFVRIVNIGLGVPEDEVRSTQFPVCQECITYANDTTSGSLCLRLAYKLYQKSNGLLSEYRK